MIIKGLSPPRRRAFLFNPGINLNFVNIFAPVLF